ncbi:MAG: GIY-YIG nuclease family protein [Patescibacteria group bacterium]|nr:GIY-YIG nuclease family protein [Patescibacteria group bacterium]
MYYTYVLKSLKNGKLYTGSTNNLVRRLEEHNSGKSKYTRLTRPFKIIYKEEFKTRSEAHKRELFLKTGKGREWFKTILNKRD